MTENNNDAREKKKILQIIGEALLTIFVFAAIFFLVTRLADERHQQWLLECRDGQRIQQLSDSGKSDFYLLGYYYCLPCKLSDFTERGWEFRYTEKYEERREDDRIPPHQRMKIELRHKSGSETCTIICDVVNEEPNLWIHAYGTENQRDNIIAVQLSGVASNDGIIQYGINLLTPEARIREIMNAETGQKDDTGEEILIWDGETVRYRIRPRAIDGTKNEIHVYAWSEQKMDDYPEYQGGDLNEP